MGAVRRSHRIGAGRAFSGQQRKRRRRRGEVTFRALRFYAECLVFLTIVGWGLLVFSV